MITLVLGILIGDYDCYIHLTNTSARYLKSPLKEKTQAAIRFLSFKREMIEGVWVNSG